MVNAKQIRGFMDKDSSMMAKKKSSNQTSAPSEEIAEPKAPVPNSLGRKPEKPIEAFCACDWGLMSREKSPHGGWVETHAMNVGMGRALIRTIAWPEIGKPSVALELVTNARLTQAAGPGTATLASR